MKLNGRQTREVNNVLQKYSRQRRGPEFVNMVARNILKLKHTVTSLNEQEIKHSDEFKKYDEQRTTVCKEMADKTAAGDPIMNFSPDGRPVSYKIVERKDEFDKAVSKLKEEFADVVEEEAERKKEFEEFLDSEKSEEEINLRCISFDAVPMHVDPDDPKSSEMVVEPGDLAVFMEYGIIADDEDNVVRIPQPPKNPSSKKSKPRNRKRRA